jgi:seryl-tRNA synthetase
MKLIGILLVLNGIALTAWWVTTHGSHKASVIAVCSIAVFAGLALILQDRITELTVKGVGSIKAAAEQAASDANAIDSLKSRVESQSATVDLVAQEASKAKKLSEEVAEKNERAEKKLETLDESIAKAKSTLDDLESITDYTMTVVAAQNDDRKAFDKLKTWSEDKNHPFRERAQQAWNSVFESHNKPYSVGGFRVPWVDGFDPSKLSLNDLANQYKQAPAQLRPALLEYIWNRNDIPKIDRLDFLMEVMETDESLNAVEYAGRHFTSGTEQKIKPLAVDHLSKWWKEHRNEFKEEKPNQSVQATR